MITGIRFNSLLRVFTLFISLIVLLFWVKEEGGKFFKQTAGRFASFKIRPDQGIFRKRVLIERVNIHIPDFAKLANALNSGGRPAGVMEGCVDYHRDVIEALPGRHDAYLAKGVCEYYLGRPADAQASLERALALHPNTFWGYYDLGMLYYNSGLFPQAVQMLKRAIERGSSYDGKEALGSKVISDVLRADGKRDPAQTFRRAYLDALQAVASGCFILNDLACATEYAEVGRQAGNGEEDSLVLLGVGLLREGNPKRAVIVLSEAVQRYPESGSAYFFLGRLLKEAQDAEGSARYLQRSRELGFDPDRYLSGQKFPLRLY